MPGLAHRDHAAIERIERRRQRGGSMALVVVRDGARTPALHRQAWLPTIERLDLALLGFMYKPTTSSNLSSKRGSRESLKLRLRCGFRPLLCQTRRTVVAPVQFDRLCYSHRSTLPGG